MSEPRPRNPAAAPVRASAAAAILAFALLPALAVVPAFAVALIPTPAAAQDAPPDTLRIGLEEAVARALDRGEEVALAREQIQRTETQIRQARSTLLPQLDANVTYDRLLRSVFDVEPPETDDPPPGDDPPLDLSELFGDLPFGQPNTWIAALQLNQTLYTGGRVSAAIEIAERARSAASLNLNEAESEVARDVRQAYFEAVHAASLEEIAQESLALANQQLEQVELFRDRGTASDFEVLQARVERDNVEPQIVDARNARELAELNLRRLLNLPHDQPIELTSPLDADPVDIDRRDVMEAALDRPSLRAAQERVRIEESSVRIARADRLPNVSAFANFSFQAFPERIIPTGLPGGSQWRDDWSMGLQVSIPVFDGFQRSAAIDESRSNVRTAQLQRDQLEEAVEMEVAAAHAEYESALAQIEARRATVDEARRAMELAELRYENGLARLIEVSNARLLLQQARSNEANALLNYVSALADLEHAAAGQLEFFQP